MTNTQITIKEVRNEKGHGPGLQWCEDSHDFVPTEATQADIDSYEKWWEETGQFQNRLDCHAVAGDKQLRFCSRNFTRGNNYEYQEVYEWCLFRAAMRLAAHEATNIQQEQAD